jgi:isocitrate/isopropylmalate dehydrogenase
VIDDQIVAFLQYVKQETLTTAETGKEARATRLITERASRRIGQMAFEIALGRPRKVCVVQYPDCTEYNLVYGNVASHCHP